MRIRKHANGACSSFSVSSSTSLIPRKRVINPQTQLCELNQSPWDVIPFAPQDYICERNEYQSEDSKSERGRESVGIIGRLEQSWYAKEERKEEAEEEKKDSCVETEKKLKRICTKRGGKGWRCQKEAREGHCLCSHHLMQRRAYRYEPCRKSDDEEAVDTGARRCNSRKKPLASSDFCYYSGFGPLWGKKRRANKEKGGEIENVINAGTVALSSANQDYRHGKHDHGGDDDDVKNGNCIYDDDEDDVEFRKKKGRKPMKARSLKSLL